MARDLERAFHGTLLALFADFFVLLAWQSGNAVAAPSPAIEVTVNAPAPGTKLTAIATGAVTIYRPLGDVRAKGLQHISPLLPTTAAAKKLKGDVSLNVETAKSGDVRKVTVDRSSGSALLDETARAWVQAVWRYPAVEQPEVHHEQIRFEPTKIEIASAATEAARVRTLRSNTPSVPYPGVAIYNRWQGTVRMKLFPDGSGGVKEAQVIASSNVPLLDLVSKAWCESYWKLPSKTVTDCSITFRLR